MNQINRTILIKWGIGLAVILWFFGSSKLPVLHSPIVTIFNKTLTIEHLLLLLAAGYVIRYLPRKIQTVVAVLFVLWLFSVFFYTGIGWLGNVIIAAIIVVVFFYMS